MLDYFSPQQTFDQSTINSASKTAVRKDVYDKKPTQNTQSASEQKEAFAEHLENAKKKSNHSEENKNVAQKNRDNVKIDHNVKAQGVGTNEDVLETVLEHITKNSDTLELVQAPTTTDTNVTGEIDALTAEIRSFLTQLMEESQDETGDDQIDLNALLSTLQDDGELQNLFDILSFALNLSTSAEAPTKTQLDILDTITDQLKDLNDKSIITSGLTPQDITDLQEKIASLISNEHAQEEQEILAELASIITQLNQAKDAVKEAPKTISKSANVIPATLDTPPAGHHTQARYDGRYDLARTTEGRAEQAPQNTNLKGEQPANTPAPMQGTPTNAAPANAASSAADPLLSFDALLQNQNTGAATTTAQTPLQSSASNIITQSQSAAHAHPATQAVSVTIQRAVKGGESTDIKLQLDPPELGRVEVKMSIDKDNTTKIVLTAEKPETYMMLQKDSHVLERAMAEAGLNADDGLSFELASENDNFGERGKDGHGSSGQKSANHDDGTIINSSMDWHVDPNTGHMHYSILA